MKLVQFERLNKHHKVKGRDKTKHNYFDYLKAPIISWMYWMMFLEIQNNEYLKESSWTIFAFF